jgi:hypothetical protein
MRQREGWRMVGSDTRPDSFCRLPAGSIISVCSPWLDLDGAVVEEVVVEDGVDVEDKDEDSGRGMHCFISKKLVAVI